MTRWIALEGGEGSGKSTQARLLAASLDAVLTREPGGTPLGAALRSLLLDADLPIEPRAEALLMAADRAAHVASVVGPALASGKDVVSDRSAWSSLAYQGYGRGLDVGELWRISDWAMEGRWPDLVVLLDVASPYRDAAADRIERAGADFHQRVCDGFLALAAQHGWLVVDGAGTIEEVADRIRKAV